MTVKAFGHVFKKPLKNSALLIHAKESNIGFSVILFIRKVQLENFHGVLTKGCSVYLPPLIFQNYP